MRALPVLAQLVALSTSLACQPRPAQDSASADDRGSCEARRQNLVSLLERLPEHSLGSSVEVQLPEAALGGSLGSGPVLEVSRTALRLDGAAISGSSPAEQHERLRQRLTELARQGEPATPLTVNVAAAFDVDVRSLRRSLAALPADAELRLLFGAPPVPLGGAGERTGHELARRLLAERDPERRRVLAREGYRALSECDAIEEAAASTEGLPSSERWPRLRQALLSATKSCACDSFQADDLKHLVVAEQRAGSMAFGSIPLSFLRDERCGASMPLRSMQKLLTQIEDFDAEFAGDWQQDALSFERVLTDERLLNYFCDALPGETLAALQRARATLYFRVGDGTTCQAWQFQPLSPGAPLGTWRRVGGKPLAFHYWQGAEEIRIFGPAGAGSKPTDKGSWACNQNLEMLSVDQTSIALERGSWYFSEQSCLAATPDAAIPGCVGDLAAGAPPATESDGAVDSDGASGPASKHAAPPE